MTSVAHKKRRRRNRTGKKKSSRKQRTLKIFVGGDFSDAQQRFYNQSMINGGYTQAERTEMIGLLNFVHKYINDNAERFHVPADTMIHHIITHNGPVQLRAILNSYMDAIENEGSVAI